MTLTILSLPSLLIKAIYLIPVISDVLFRNFELLQAGHGCTHFLFFFTVVVPSRSVDFIFNGFNDTETNLTREGASNIKPSGALRLTNKSQHVIGHAFYPDPIQLYDNNSSSSSFSTYFVFSIIPQASGRGGYGLAFTLSPSKQFPGAESEHFLGLFNSSNDNKTSNHIFAVEFDTVNGHQENLDSEGNHVGININSVSSVASEPASYYVDTSVAREMKLESGNPVQAWIEYNATEKLVNVTISPSWIPKPDQPLLSHSIDLSSVLKESMYVGFSASTGKKSSSHYILGWSFRMNGVASSLDLSRLPIPPYENSSSSFKPQLKLLIAALSVVIFFLLGAFFVYLYRRKMQPEILEDWELDCPHRFRFKDLHAATMGFKESAVIGVGGFGAVYKGVLPTNGCEVAVKKIARNSIQGTREFAAEVESLGRLRHKHLVNLQGWCKQKNDLLLVYDYVPHGSLDSLLYNLRNNFVLGWEQRFNILKGIAAGLLYLHEEWEQVVIHRDVKSGNVLIDADMNARLGDFGLARLYDHGKNSHTTNVVGTIGYIAPELARTGKASESSDVFAYGVLLLEVACGRRPIESNSQPAGPLILVDWVIECLQMGRLLDAVDPKLNSMYAIEEMELVLRLGLVCSHQIQEARPTMRQVMRYLNGDERLPEIDDWGSVDSRRIDSMTSRFLEVSSTDMMATLYCSSSIGDMSSSSIEIGR